VNITEHRQLPRPSSKLRRPDDGSDLLSIESDRGCRTRAAYGVAIGSVDVNVPWYDSMYGPVLRSAAGIV
jgi:hypothetical protein